MRSLTPDDVRAMAEAVGLPMSAEDLVEVTHRLNAFLAALGPLGTLPLDRVEPIPIALDPRSFAPDTRS